MLIKHINPILLNKLLKSSQEMRALLTYLKTSLFYLWNGHIKALLSRDAIQIKKKLLYLRIQSMIGYEMNKSNDILISDTHVLSPWKKLLFCLLAIFIIYYYKVQFQLRNVALVMLLVEIFNGEKWDTHYKNQGCRTYK